MGERLTLPEIVARICAKKIFDKSSSEQFMAALIETIQEQLVNKRVAKVRGLGTFKLEWFAQRTIANVNTGEESQIGGHYRIAFTPEKEVSARINSNYSHLQTIVLSSEDAFRGEEDGSENPTKKILLTEKAANMPAHRAPINDILSELVEARSIINEMSTMVDPELGTENNVVQTVTEIETQILMRVDSAEERVIEVVEKNDTIPHLAQSNESVWDINLEENTQKDDVKELICDVDKRMCNPVCEEKDAEVLLLMDESVCQMNESISEAAADEENTIIKEQPINQIAMKKQPVWITTTVTVISVVILGIFGYIYIEYFGITAHFSSEKLKVETPSIFDKASIWLKKVLTIDKIQDETIGHQPIGIGIEGSNTDNESTLDRIESNTVPPTVMEPVRPEPAISSKSEDGKYVKLMYGETLSTLSRIHYGRSEFWCYIYEANKRKLGNIHHIKSGTRLLIPDVKKYNINGNDSVSVQQARKKCDDIILRMNVK